MQIRLGSDGLGETKRSNWHRHRLLTGHEKQRLAVRHAQTGATSTFSRTGTLLHASFWSISSMYLSAAGSLPRPAKAQAVNDIYEARTRLYMAVMMMCIVGIYSSRN
jgi:hypothetical protein